MQVRRRVQGRIRGLFAPVFMRRSLVSVHREVSAHTPTSSVVVSLSFFVQLFPRALVHFPLCIRHLPFSSAAHPPSQPVPCAQSPAPRSCWLAVNVTVVPPIHGNRHHAYIVLSASWPSHTHILSVLLFHQPLKSFPCPPSPLHPRRFYLSFLRPRVYTSGGLPQID